MKLGKRCDRGRKEKKMKEKEEKNKEEKEIVSKAEQFLEHECFSDYFTESTEFVIQRKECPKFKICKEKLN